jgi:hypothetical protein
MDGFEAGFISPYHQPSVLRWRRIAGANPPYELNGLLFTCNQLQPYFGSAGKHPGLHRTVPGAVSLTK